MKFTALKTDTVALDGIRAYQFVEGEDYDIDGAQLARLQELGIAPAGEAKPFNPVAETKPAAPVAESKMEVALAIPQTAEELEAMNIEQLRSIAKGLELSLKSKAKQADIIAAILAKQAEAA